MCRKVHVEEPRRSTSGGQSAGRDGVGSSDWEDGEVEVDKVELGEGGEVAVDEGFWCLIIAAQADNELQERHLGSSSA